MRLNLHSRDARGGYVIFAVLIVIVVLSLVAYRFTESMSAEVRASAHANDDAQAKLATMSDKDLHTLASASKGLPSGGDGTGAIIGVLVVVILIIVILRLTNHDLVVR